MTVTVLDRTLVVGDAGRVTGERQERPEPEAPEPERPGGGRSPRPRRVAVQSVHSVRGYPKQPGSPDHPAQLTLIGMSGKPASRTGGLEQVHRVDGA
jgi:hypothetical protein